MLGKDVLWNCGTFSPYQNMFSCILEPSLSTGNPFLFLTIYLKDANGVSTINNNVTVDDG